MAIPRVRARRAERPNATLIFVVGHWRTGTTLLHELLHISKPFDGTLDPERRHSKVPPARFEALLRPLVKRYLQEGDAALLGALAHHGEVLARQWLERPTGRGNGKQTYTEKDLFLGPVQMITRRRLHS